ncbi:MAG: serine/threonine-protein kinase [Aeoliella sp.]
MSLPNSSVLVRAAEASRLVTPEQLHCAVVSACDSGDESTVTAQEVSDDAIGRRLVELGYLNAWQVDQLKEGRSRFSLGPYRILDAIGRGGMGHVFKVEHELLGRVEAIKVLPRNKTNTETIARFRHEIRTQAQLDHPNLVRVNYADHEGDTYFFVTEFVPGADLRKIVRRLGPLGYEAAALIVQQAAEGLEHAHRRGLIHRDIKPGNLLVTPDAVTKLIDLGLAWYLEADIHAAKQGDRLKIVGTADYLAPETIRDPGRIVPVSDIYSLGCTLYYAVTGKVPFPGGNPAEKMERHVKETPLSPEQLQPNLPQGFVQLISEMMTKDPKQRVPSAAAVAERLKAWASETSIAEVSAAVEQVETLWREEGPQSSSSGPNIDDTLTFDDDDDPFEGLFESPSQGSQGTDPIAAATHETQSNDTPDIVDDGQSETVTSVRLGRWVVASIVLAVVATLGVAGTLLWELLG